MSMQVHDSLTVTMTVAQQHTAAALGSGGLAVLGTPQLAAAWESAAYRLMQTALPEGKSSVGVQLAIDHLSPTPVGMTFHATATVTAISEDGRFVDFALVARDEAGKIGEGTHRRAMIDSARFLAKCEQKKAQAE